MRHSGEKFWRIPDSAITGKSIRAHHSLPDNEPFRVGEITFGKDNCWGTAYNSFTVNGQLFSDQYLQRAHFQSTLC